MPYLIDGNNLMGSAPDFCMDDPDRRSKIIALVRKFQESKNAKVTIVFDGDPGTGMYRQAISPGFVLVFPKPGSTADDEIKKILRGSSAVQNLLLVTSDRELKSFAKNLRVGTRNSGEFYHELRRAFVRQGRKEETQKRIHASLSQSEVENWLRIFAKDR